MRRGLTFLTLLLVAVSFLFDLRSTSVSNATSSDGDEFVAREVVVKLTSARGSSCDCLPDTHSIRPQSISLATGQFSDCGSRTMRRSKIA